MKPVTKYWPLHEYLRPLAQDEPITLTFDEVEAIIGALLPPSARVSRAWWANSATPQGQATVIIALTATVFEEDREKVLLEGCDDFVRKPFRKDEIYDMLAKHLEVQFLYEGGPAPWAPAGPTEADAPAAYALSPEALAELPATWVTDLQQATTKADLHLILSLIDQIRGQDVALADALTELAQNYEYKKILNLIEQSGG